MAGALSAKPHRAHVEIDHGRRRSDRLTESPTDGRRRDGGRGKASSKASERAASSAPHSPKPISSPLQTPIGSHRDVLLRRLMFSVLHAAWRLRPSQCSWMMLLLSLPLLVVVQRSEACSPGASHSELEEVEQGTSRHSAIDPRARAQGRKKQGRDDKENKAFDVSASVRTGSDNSRTQQRSNTLNAWLIHLSALLFWCVACVA